MRLKVIPRIPTTCKTGIIIPIILIIPINGRFIEKRGNSRAKVKLSAVNISRIIGI
jgi:hypothetical protein